MKRPRKQSRESSDLRPAKARKQTTYCLSDELLLSVFTLLSFRELARCSQVDHRWHGIADDEKLWELLYKEAFGRGVPHGIAPKDMYKLTHNWCKGQFTIRKYENEGLIRQVGEMLVMAKEKLVVREGKWEAEYRLPSVAKLLAVDESGWILVAMEQSWLLFLRSNEKLHLMQNRPAQSVSQVAVCAPFATILCHSTLFVFRGADTIPVLTLGYQDREYQEALSLSMRRSEIGVITTVALAVATLMGHAVALQQIILDPETCHTQQHGSSAILPAPSRSMAFYDPYLIAAHTDNTLTLYTLGPGGHLQEPRRMWGHTSQVYGAGIGHLRAVSIGEREVRVWELPLQRPGTRTPLHLDGLVEEVEVDGCSITIHHGVHNGSLILSF